MAEFEACIDYSATVALCLYLHFFLNCRHFRELLRDNDGSMVSLDNRQHFQLRREGLLRLLLDGRRYQDRA